LAGSGEKWRWADSEGVQRVVQTDELRAALANGAVPPTALVWRAGMPKWQRASEVPELTGAPAPSLRSTIVGIPPPPATIVAVQAAFEQGRAPQSAPPTTKPQAAPSSAPAGETAKAAAPKRASAGGRAATAETKKKSVPPPSGAAAAQDKTSADNKKKSAPAGVSAATAEPAPKSVPHSQGEAAKKKSMPPPAPPAPAIKPAASAAPSFPEPTGKETGKPSHVPANAWGSPSTKPGATSAAPKQVVPPAEPAVDPSEAETWVAKPAVTFGPPEQGAHPGAAPPSSATPGAPPTAPSMPPHAQPPGKASTFPLMALPPTRMTSPLPPPPRRSHPAPGAHLTPSTAPQAFSQSNVGQVPPFGRDGFAPPSFPPPQPVAGAVPAAAPNGGADGELPAFPLDEIDPDDERPFRPSQGVALGSPATGHPASFDASPNSSGSLRGMLAYIKANPKDPKLLAGLGGGAVLVVGLLWGMAAMSGAKRPGTDETSTAPPVALPDPSANAAASGAPTPSALAAAPAPVNAAACRPMGTPARLAEKASKDIPLELLVSSSTEKAHLGFATAANAAHGVVVDLASLQVTPEFTKPPKEKLRAVLPFGDDAVEFVAQVDGHSDKFRPWRIVSVDPPTVIGWSAVGVAVANKANQAPTALWSLEGNDPIETIRVAHTADGGHAIVFRRRGVIHGGTMGRDRAAVGEVTRIAGAGAPPGSPVGTPTVAVNEQSVAVAFADRASSDEPWSIRIGAAPLGSFPATTTPFVVPAGGPGGATLAPALSGLSDGRWLLVWTEGSGGNHDVRGVTLGADLAPIGSAFTVSREGSNAGQGAVALRAGRGLVAYLALTEEGYDVWGTGVDCR
jgi:hypothetical protein